MPGARLLKLYVPLLAVVVVANGRTAGRRALEEVDGHAALRSVIGEKPLPVGSRYLVPLMVMVPIATVPPGVVVIAGWPGDRHRLGGGAAGDRGVVGVAVEGGHPVVGARRRGRVARRRRRGRAAADADRHGGDGVQRRAAVCVVLLLYSLNVTVSLLLGLTRPVTVAVSLIDSPT